jgi:hypothetical protein
MLVRKDKEMKIFNLIITTKKKHDDFTIKCMEILERQNKLSNWSAINPVIHSLKELRNNTWDVERVDQAINWLRDNFEVK